MSSVSSLFNKGGLPPRMLSFEERPGHYGEISPETVKHAIEMAQITETKPFGRKPAADVVYNTAKATSFGKRPYAIVAPSINEATAIAKQTEEQNPFDRNGTAAGNAILNASVTQKTKTAETIAFEDKVKDAVDVVLKTAKEVAQSATKAGFFATKNASSCGQEAKQEAEVNKLAIPSPF